MTALALDIGGGIVLGAFGVWLLWLIGFVVENWWLNRGVYYQDRVKEWRGKKS